MIVWKNFDSNSNDNTKIPWEVYGFINLLCGFKIIPPGTRINAEFMNKYHPEILWEEYKKGCGMNHKELKEYFKDLIGGDIK